MAKRGENIRKRKDGRYEARLIDYYKENGKAHYKSLYAKSYTEVKQKMKSYQTATAKKVAPSKKSIDEFCQEWLDKTRLRVKESPFARYYTVVYNHILPYFKDYRISAVTRESVEKFADYKLKELSPKTVRDITSILVQLLKYIERSGYITGFNYDIDLPKVHMNELELLTYIEEQKLDAYLKNHMTPENFGILLTKSTGLRIGEICALKWSDFDIDKGTIYINKTLQRVKNFDETA